MKILLVDDDEDDFIITRDLLADIEGVDFEIDWIPEYDKALETILEDRHDVYLVDYRLGRENGLDLLRSAVSSGCCKGPIIFLTGQGDREVDIEAMNAGASDYLSKLELNSSLLERSIRYSVERFQTREKLAQLAQFDPLTGLPNRRLFFDRLNQSISQAARDSTVVGLVFLDLDRFKIINDSLGHAAGDQLLKGVANRLNRCVRECDTIARLGGDEFVVILPRIEDNQSAAVVARRIIDIIPNPFMIEGNEVFTTASIGIAIYPNDGRDAETLVKNADHAMYIAKDQGGNTYKYFSRELNGHISNRLTMESALHRAIDRQEFRLFYQPFFDFKTGNIRGIEALLRWQLTESRKTIYPDQFIQVLEETGMIDQVGEWIMQTAFLKLKSLHNEGFKDLRMAVNIAGRQLKQPNFPDRVKRILSNTGVNPAYIDFEFTENAINDNFDRDVRLLDSLKKIGISIVLDDFGSGMSSLLWLKKFNFDKLKIDNELVQNALNDEASAAICNSVISLAGYFKILVCAEAVENLRQHEYLKESGCHEFQGNFKSQPLESKQVSAFLNQNPVNEPEE